MYTFHLFCLLSPRGWKTLFHPILHYVVVKVKERVEEQQQRLLDLQRQEASEGERPSEAYNGELENIETREVMVVFLSDEIWRTHFPKYGRNVHNEPVFAQTWLTHVLLKHKDHNGSLFACNIWWCKKKDSHWHWISNIRCYFIHNTTFYVAFS